MEALENWLLNVALGKAVARTAVIVAAYVAGPVVQGLAAKAGVSLAVSPAQLEVGLQAAAHWAFEWFKARRAANPASPAVQTDASKLPV